LETLRTLASLFVRRDVIVLVTLFSLFGTLIGYFALPAEFSGWTRALGGLIVGFNGSLFVVGPRMVGGDDFDG
jgi:hypothetical protein